MSFLYQSVKKSGLSEEVIQLLDNIPDGIVVLDKLHNILFVNNAFSKISGISLNSNVMHTCKDIFESNNCKTACPIEKLKQPGEIIYNLDSFIKYKNDSLIPVELSATPLTILSDSSDVFILTMRPKGSSVYTTESNKNTGMYGVIGKSKIMMEIISTIKGISDSFATVLITGETGVGKEVIADAIQKSSQRADAPYLKVNCASLPNTLLSSELFGHAKGAFTNAISDRRGRFELADGGTLFLDEIAEIPMEMQPLFLRILQNGMFERLGEDITRKSDVRIIAATNKNIESEILKNNFREDLYYRLNVFPIYIPPLRERKEDIPLFVEYFIQECMKQYNMRPIDISDGAMDILTNYSWYGNIRQLKNCIEYMYLRTKRGNIIEVKDLPEYVLKEIQLPEDADSKFNESEEKDSLLLALLKANNWNKSKVANILGVHRSTIHRRIKNLS